MSRTILRSWREKRVDVELKHFLEQEGNAKAGLRGTYRVETTCDVEFLRMRIPDDMKGGGPVSTGNLSGVLEEQTSDAASANLRLDEQTIELGLPIGTGLDGGESNKCAVQLREEYAAPGKLLSRHFNRAGVGEECVSISRVGERCAELQGFNLRLLRRHSRANQDSFHNLKCTFKPTRSNASAKVAAALKKATRPNG